MMNPPNNMIPLSNESNILELNTAVDALMAELQQIKSRIVELNDADSLEKFEREMHAKTSKLADLLSAIKLQEALDSKHLTEAEKELLKSHPKKMKNMGIRPVTVRMLGGTPVTVSTPYYHQKNALKKKEK